MNRKIYGISTKMIPQIPKMLMLFAFMWLSASGYAQSDFSKIDSWMEVHTKDMGGRSILVIYKEGKLVYSKSVNEMNRLQKMADRYIAKRMKGDAGTEDYAISTRQPIASCSKWLSAALVMTFVDEGKLSLTDTVGKYLQVLSQHGKGKITISDCLSHLTGVNEPALKERLKEMRNISSMDEAIAQIAIMPMDGEPGKTFHYSNAGLQIAGAVIEKISGKSFENLFAERIANPLGMKNTDFGKGRVALPAGGASSTPEDYSNFLMMILNKGVFNGRRILSEKSVTDMQVNRIGPDVKIAYAPAEARSFGYGYGEWVMEKSTATNLSKAVTSPGLFGSFPWIDNEKKYTGFLMTFYVKSEGRHQRYVALKRLVDEAVQ